MHNQELIRQFHELAELTKIEDGSAQSFRVRAYEKAVRAIEAASEDLTELSTADLQKLEGVGKSTAEKIREYATEGVVRKLAKLREAYPREFVELSRIPGVGPKTLILLRDELGVQNLEDLKAALVAEKLRDLPGLGAKTEEKITKSIDRLGLHGKDRRTPIHVAMPIAREFVDALAAMDNVEQAQYCGSLRRFAESIGDVDIVVAASDRTGIMERFAQLPAVAEVLAQGDTKSSILTSTGLQVDLRIVEPSEWGAATLYFTGSKTHNIELRQRALKRGWTLNEYALSDIESEAVVASKTEKAIYTALDLAYVNPRLREGIGELVAADDDSLPDLVELADLKGDLHVHSDWSGDGRSTLEAMVAAQAERGFSYMALTDHGEDLAMNGLSRKRMLEQRRVLLALQEEYPDFHLLHGCELNIDAEGNVDYDEGFLAGFGYTVASVHSYFDLDIVTQTARVVRAMQNPAVNAIGHLTGRKLGKRPGIEVDLDAVFEAAELTGTAIEINGHLQRLDATSDALRAARGSNVQFVIDTDAHHVNELENSYYGCLNAQRGWVDKAQIVNTWSTKRFLDWVESKRDG